MNTKTPPCPSDEEGHPWRECLKGSCHRNETCLYTPCMRIRATPSDRAYLASIKSSEDVDLSAVIGGPKPTSSSEEVSRLIAFLKQEGSISDKAEADEISWCRKMLDSADALQALLDRAKMAETEVSELKDLYKDACEQGLALASAANSEYLKKVIAESAVKVLHQSVEKAEETLTEWKVIASAECASRIETLNRAGTAEAALSAANARIAVLEKALEPFVKYADEFDAWDLAIDTLGPHRPNIHLCRRAREVRRSGKGE